MKEKLIQLMVCPGKDNGSAVCLDCCCRGKSDCFKALKAECINAMQGTVTVHKPFNLKVRITEILHEIGVPAHIKGYEYTRELIKLAVNDPHAIHRITFDLYPAVAKTFQTVPSRVERAVRHAVEVAWDRGDLDILQKWFGNTICSSKGKPTNGEFIALLADKIRLEVESNG